MALYTISARRGEHYKDYVATAADTAPTVNGIALTFDTTGGAAGMNKGDLQLFLMEALAFLDARKFPPA
jgi:hypothetical protein